MTKFMLNRNALFGASFFPFLFSCDSGKVSTYESYLNHNDTVKYFGKEQ